MDLTAILGTLGLVAGCVAIGLLIDRYVVRVLPRAEDLGQASARAAARAAGRDHAPGTAASAAIACGPRRMRRIADRRRCACRRRMARAGEDRARLGEREVIVLRLRCDGCGAVESLYFAPPRRA